MKVNRSDFLYALTQVKPGLAKNDFIEHTDHFCFLNDMIVTYNDHIQIAIQYKTGMTGAVPSKELYAVLNKIPDSEIEIEQNENKIVIRGKRKKAGFVFSDINEVLKEALIHESRLKKWRRLPEDFTECLRLCLFSVSKDISKPILTCISAKEDSMLSSDNIRVTKKQMAGTIPDELLIPGDSASELVKYEPIKYCKTESWIHFQTQSGIIFSSRTIDGKFPNVSKWMRVDGITVKLPKTLPEIISRCKALLDQDNLISLTLSKGKLLCKSTNQKGYYEEESRVIYSGATIDITVNAEFMAQIISIVRKATLGENTLLFEGEGFSHVLCINK